MARTLPELIAAVEEIRSDYEQVQGELWEHEPLLPKCEYLLGAPIVELDMLINYLTEQQEARVDD